MSTKVNDFSKFYSQRDVSRIVDIGSRKQAEAAAERGREPARMRGASRGRDVGIQALPTTRVERARNGRRGGGTIDSSRSRSTRVARAAAPYTLL